MTADHGEHLPVLAEAAVEALLPGPGRRLVDATFGRGGHSARILERLGGEGRLLALDRDPEAVDHGRSLFGADPRFRIDRYPFSRLAEAVAEAGWPDGVDGVLADLGVSSPQLDDPHRGFSFRGEGPLDMRMDPGTGASAAEWLRGVDSGELERVLREYGEERHARRVARAIIAAREQTGLATTTGLAEVVRSAVPGRGEPGKDKATRTFQAIRMAVNDELGELEAFLAAAVEVLRPSGRLVVIAFHSLEDRMVKRFIREEARSCVCPPDFPVCRCDKVARLRPVGKPLRPEAGEQEANPRARSAIARVAERLAA
ncbi:16S rRNA (cytosine(1402)-N(4))-methyltransferase RsmH [Thiohalorhabdus methylotrophus]|uniref:Ribosomal RNA small subunit methyltransferase H n=1 Tax=Thiohalorhabdus methylotrophus TaxID=3242694 RepID=A0ABV4TVR8_9GAMM